MGNFVVLIYDNRDMPNMSSIAKGALFLGKCKNGFVISGQWILLHQKNAKCEKGLFSMTMQTNKPIVVCNFKNKNKKIQWLSGFFVLENSSMEMPPEKKKTLAIDKKVLLCKNRLQRDHIFAVYFFSCRKGANNIIAVKVIDNSTNIQYRANVIVRSYYYYTV